MTTAFFSDIKKAALKLNHILKMIARQKNSGFGWKLEDFEFRAAFTIIQHFHFFF
jgi:hypothetical protein